MISKKLFFKALFFLLLVGNYFFAQVNLSLDTNFNTGSGIFTNTNADKAVVLPDDKILLMGQFESYNGSPTNSLIRLNSDGTLDKTFTASSIMLYNYINSPIIKVLKSGKILIAGNLGGKGALIRLNTDGSKDTGFLSATMLANEYVTSIDELSNGKIVVGGTFTSFNGEAVKAVIILNEDGTRDTTFNISNTIIPTGSLYNYNVYVLSDNKIIVNGYFMVGTSKLAKTYKFNTDGTLDTSFSSSNAIVLSSFCLRPDGKILYTGTAIKSDNYSYKHGLHLMDQNGTVDQTFNASGDGFMNYSGAGLKLLSNGKILLFGMFNAYNGVTRNRIAVINADGSLDTTFDPVAGFDISSSDPALIADVQSDDKIIVAGHFAKYNNDLTNSIARLNNDGTKDSSFNEGNFGIKRFGEYKVVTQLSDGKYMVGGRYVMLDGKESLFMTKLNTDGTIDTSFKSYFDESVSGIIELADGKLMVGGSFFNYGTTQFIQRLVILNPDGTLNTQIKPTANHEVGTVNTLKKDQSGKIVLAADVYGLGAAKTTYGLNRLNADGSLDTSFNASGTGTNYGAYVQKIYFQPDGKIIIIGPNLTSYNGTTINGIARINTDGTLDTSFKQSTGVSPSINNVSLLPSGKMFIIGFFTSYGGFARPGIALLNSDGSVDETFNPTYSGYPQGSQLLSDGSLLFSGTGTSFSGTTMRGNLARIFTDGTADSNFNTNITGVGGGAILNFFTQNDGKIIGYGRFNSYNGVTRNYIARFEILGTSTLKNQEINLNKTTIYPNPAKDFITISNLIKGSEITIYELSGKVLYRTTATKNEMTINTSLYKNGIYLVKTADKVSKLIISK